LSSANHETKTLFSFLRATCCSLSDYKVIREFTLLLILIAVCR